MMYGTKEENSGKTVGETSPMGVTTITTLLNSVEGFVEELDIQLLELHQRIIGLQTKITPILNPYLFTLEENKLKDSDKVIKEQKHEESSELVSYLRKITKDIQKRIEGVIQNQELVKRIINNVEI